VFRVDMLHEEGPTFISTAVQAGLTLRWSNGPVEGQINRLKMLKHQMLGRAKIDLLRQRFLLAA
jgi:transposase